MREGAREIDELPLADAERGTTFVDGGGDAFGERGDEIGETDFFAGAQDGFAVYTGRAETNVGLNSAAEKKRILKDEIGRASCRERV